MHSYGFVVPLLPGMEERNRTFAAQLMGELRAEYAASRARLGITREQVWLQQTPQGVMSVVLLEAEDVMAALGGLAMSEHPFDQWWREQILEMHGFDIRQPPPGPPNDLIVDFRGSA